MNYYYQIEGDLRNNIGDVLQGMVAKPFLPEPCKVADREALSDLDKNEKGFLIANGWYMHSFSKFPPPVNVTPLYISVHVAVSKLLTDEKVRHHFYENSPIGCRDHKTLKLFLGWGIPAYYSGCLTTTCRQRTAINQSGEGEVLLVDNIDHPIPADVKDKLEKLVGKPLTRISHDPPSTGGTLEEYDKASEQHMNYLLERYCKAALVITTKIHCALPCLGMGANVMLVHPNPDDPRLDTVNEFISILSYQQVREATTLEKPTIDKERLKKRQAFLSDIVNKSVVRKKNVMQAPDSLALHWIKIKSKILAKVYKTGVRVMYKTGISKEHIARVYELNK